ncbi:hypothetical protein STAQ_34400 [Allostella sp. ATCC 35155]|nr:hypothetical protein STAQ_34400 [Stella sp. ATCC 35155]
MAKPVVVSSSWTGLIVLLGTVALLAVAASFGISWFLGRTAATEQRLRTEFIEPYVAALRAADGQTAWRELTTERYRARYREGDFLANFQTVVARYGQPEAVEIVRVTGTVEPGRTFQYVRTIWQWSGGGSFVRGLQLVDVPGLGFRLDGATLGGHNGSIVPANVLSGPW